MPRPRKWKRVCSLPESDLFGPLVQDVHEREIVVMSVEEFESIRLIDQEGLTQDESAVRMNVARGTVQRLYSDARAKLAESLVNGSVLKIDGGDYQLYSDPESRRGCGHCSRNRCGRRTKE